MSKTKKIPTTIFDDHVAKKIKISIETYLIEMWKFVYSDNKSDSVENNQKDKNRSSTKTDNLHKKFSEIFIECFGNYKDDFMKHFYFEIEANINGKETKKLKSSQKDLYGKYFNIDLYLRSKNNNAIFATVLLKAPMTSIFKNRFNLIDNMLGESLRVLTKENLQSQDVTFIPNETFTLNKKHNKLRTEYSNHIALYSSTNGKDTILDESAINNEAKEKIKEIVISYDFAFKNKKFNALQDLKNEISQNNDFITVNDSTIQYLKYYIYNFLNKNKHIEEFNELLEYLNKNNISVPKPIILIDNPANKPQRRIKNKI